MTTFFNFTLPSRYLAGNDDYVIAPSCAYDRRNVEINVIGDKTYTFFSPNWPSYYINHLNCFWILKAAENLRILVVVLDIDMEWATDFVTLGEGSAPPNDTIWSTSGKPNTRLMFSEGSDMWVQMTTSVITYVEVSGFAFQIQAFNDTGKK